MRGDCISFGIIKTMRDYTEEREYFESREEAEEVFETCIEKLDPHTYLCVELTSMDWYERSGESVDYYEFEA